MYSAKIGDLPNGKAKGDEVEYIDYDVIELMKLRLIILIKGFNTSMNY